MKKLFLLLAVFTLCAGAFAQDSIKMKKTLRYHATEKKMRDCVVMEDGKMMVMKGGKTMEMTRDMTMSNGTKVMKDGTVKMKNGKTMMMKNGDCMYMDGSMRKMKEDKMKEKAPDM